MVLEGAREDALAGRERGRRDGVALEPGDLPAGEGERDRFRAVDPLALPRLEPHAPGSPRVGARPPAADRAPRSSACRARRGTTPRIPAVLPPLALHARDVVAEVHVVGQLTQASREPDGRVVTSPKQAYSSTGRGPQKGQERRKDIYGVNCTLRNAVPESATNSTSMSRTRQPSTRRIGAAERAFTVLDTLADGGELGTNEIARRTGMTPSTVSRQLGTLAASGLVERVHALGPLQARAPPRPPRERRPREARRPGGRTPPSRRPRRRDRRDRDALGTGRRGRDHGRLRPRLPPGPARCRGSAGRRSPTRLRPGR